MGLNDTPSAERVHIGFFGRRNAGKSSLVNAVTGQELSVVSPVKGTTTDPVYKSMELLPLGPVVIMDTPGSDDEGELGELRVKKTAQTLGKTDCAVLVADGERGMTQSEWDLIAMFQERKIPFLVAWNKADLADEGRTDAADGNRSAQSDPADGNQPDGNRTGAAGGQRAESLTADPRLGGAPVMRVSAVTGKGVRELKEMIARIALKDQEGREKKGLLGGLLSHGQTAVLVIPIDESAPKGRIILPQQQAIRDILDTGAFAITSRDTELGELMERLIRTDSLPDLVVTDSQAFGKVKDLVPREVPLTSFSILMARYKGFLTDAVKGAAAIRSLKEGDQVLISEGCTHHRQCNDIGTVKIPRLLKKTTGRNLKISTSSGREFPEDLSPYRLVIHCGGCMLNEREVEFRRDRARAQGVPFTNYGIALAYMNGILERSIEMFPELKEILKLL